MTKRGKTLENLALISHIGVTMLVPIIGGVYLGSWLDNRLSSQPIFLFVFIVLGVIASFISLFKVAGGRSKGK